MATKKYLLTLGLITFVQICAISQKKSSVTNPDRTQDTMHKYWVSNTITKDTSKIAKKNKDQFYDFQANQYPYPARPKDMWELGLGVGVSTMSGDLKNDIGFGATFTARKSLSHVFSLRPYVSYYQVSGNADINTNVGAFPEARSFKTTTISTGLDAIASLNTIRTYRGNPKLNFYVLVGFGVLANAVTKDYQDGNGYVPFAYPSTNTLGEIGTKTNGRGKYFLVPTFNLGGGIAYKINDRFNLGLEGKNSLTNNDYLDGFFSVFSNAFDAYWFSSLRLNMNIGRKSKRLQPLWWINPNNYVYNELNAPDHLKNRLKVKLDDADTDGITDQFDLEPNTPAGVAVDSRGRALDTDGDGIPDFKDKELLSKQECFPVNADGVGTCPETACCKESKSEIIKLQQTIDSFRNGRISGSPMSSGGAPCNLNLPALVFKSGGAKLARDNSKLLDAVAEQLKNNPNARIKVLGHPEANKTAQQKSYDRVEAIIKYLVEKQGISENRFIFSYDAGSGDANTIDLQCTTEEGPSTVPAPAPHLKGKQNF